MASYIPVENFKPDLRSSKSLSIQKGLAIRLIRVLILMFLDATSLFLAWGLATYYGTPLNSPWTNNLSLLVLTLIVGLGIFAATGQYQAGVRRRNYFSLIKAVLISELLLLLIAFLYEANSYVSRSTFLLSCLLSTIFVCVGRFVFDVATKLARQQGIARHPVFLITDVEEQEANVQLIEKENAYSILGVNNPSCLDRCNREQTLSTLQKMGIVEVFISWDAIKNRLYVCWHFQTAGITVRILPKQKEVLPRNSIFSAIGQVPSHMIPAPIVTGSGFWIKRCFDLCFSVILVLLLSPIYLLIALLIKLDSPGPVFFKQNRIGLHCHNFKIWKFRTMVTNADKMQAALESKNENKDGVLFKMKDDPRVTKVGKFLRRYSLDELPQLFNVVLGEMSLVGPRPLPIRDVEKFKTKYFIRQEVLPGMTGMWQVSGRSDIDDFEDVIKLDLDYIENWSFWLDMQILLKTVEVVLQKTGAY
ncbi:MAG: sugar transferase [Calothrix sp. C42_A2020_038]|nr:sugar transferase [Calothrix sp. C42_A2020_038]